MSQTTDRVEQEDENKQIQARLEKLNQIRQNTNAYPNDFKPTAKAACLLGKFKDTDREALEATDTEFSIAGRIMLKRVMGKASFIHIQDMSGRIQAYVTRDDLAPGLYTDFKTWDLGDIVGITGQLFRTRTNELTLHAKQIVLLTKSLRPLPDKFHGLADQEMRYRQRYVDLMTNETARDVFKMRSKLINRIRHFLQERSYMEVETPMMHPLAGGATAKPFQTHHNALDMDLFLRVAPELYLKRLVVGGFERVFEINRNFRNEGVSTRHNPEFTMLEFYEAYANYQDLMDITEEMMRDLCQHLLGSTHLKVGDHSFDLSQPFTRLSIREAIVKYNPQISMDQLNDRDQIVDLIKARGHEVTDHMGLGKCLFELFEITTESQLIEPTFITGYPKEVSPLSRVSDHNPEETDRFEFFVGGQEIANGFSELNDPEDQAERFEKQMQAKSTGDDEAMPYDADYIRALEYGMPPTAGEGIGIDRLTMLFTGCKTIKDVILFPHMRKES